MSLERRRIARASGPAEAGTLWDLRHQPFQGTAAHRYHSLRPRSAGCLGAAYPYPDDVERTNVLIPTITRAPEAGPLGHSPAWGVVLVGHRATETCDLVRRGPSAALPGSKPPCHCPQCFRLHLQGWQECAKKISCWKDALVHNRGDMRKHASSLGLCPARHGGPNDNLPRFVC